MSGVVGKLWRPASSGVRPGCYTQGNQVSVSVPGCVADGDIIIASLSDAGAGAPWTLITSVVGPFQHGSLSLYWKVASSEPASYAFNPTVPNAAFKPVILAVYKGVNTTSPINTYNSNVDPSPNQVPALTTTVAGCALIQAYNWDSLSNSNANTLTGYTVREVANLGGNDDQGYADLFNAAGGAQATPTWTNGTWSAGSGDIIQIAVALTPA